MDVIKDDKILNSENKMIKILSFNLPQITSGQEFLQKFKQLILDVTFLMLMSYLCTIIYYSVSGLVGKRVVLSKGSKMKDPNSLVGGVYIFTRTF